MANPDPSPDTRFRKGGPPGPGRPKGTLSLTEGLRKALGGDKLLGKKAPGGRSVAEWLIESMIRAAIDGRGGYMKEIMDRVEGPIPRPDPPPEDDAEAIIEAARKIVDERNGDRRGH